MKQYSLTSEKFLNDSELTQLEVTLKRFKDREPRNVLLLTLALATAGRAQELLNLTKKDLNQQNRTVFITGLKGSDSREIPLKNSLFNDLWNFCKDLQPSDSIFDISYSRLVQIWEQFKPSREKTFHSLRHTKALQVYRSKNDIKLVQILLGHRNISNSLVYLDFVYKQEELRKLLC